MSTIENDKVLNVDAAVRERYGAAAAASEPALCCPVSYDPQYLKVIPAEIIERDYGCGDPSQFLQPGDHVLDLGSGGGKICYIASQVVGPNGYVVGVDINDQMLGLARQYQGEVANLIGYHNTEFRKGRIQDLQLNMDLFEAHLAANPIHSAADWLAADEVADQLRAQQPLVASNSIDAVVSNCVLNLVKTEDRKQLFAEVYRVLKDGGRAIISDIVSDEDVPESLQNNADLWSGCISGAFREDQFLKAFEDAGFYGLEIVSRQENAWAVVEGIEFRSLTVRAWKGKEGPCIDRHQAVIYNGPWKAVIDDDGHKLLRGQRMAVSEKAAGIYTSGPYASQITAINPVDVVPAEQASAFDWHGMKIRDPKVTKRGKPKLNLLPGQDCCGEASSCC